MRIAFLLAACICLTTAVLAQVRVVSVVENPSYPFRSVKITGVGFSNTMTDLNVWFGNVKGTITSSTTTSIDVTVPGQARLSNIEVVNVATKRSGFYKEQFMPKFNGVTPYAANFTALATETSANLVIDLCTCDLDGDGKTDIVGTRNVTGEMNLMLLKNISTVNSTNGTVAGSTLDFNPPGSITLAFPTQNVTCGDLNGDGKPELVATRGGSTSSTMVFIFTNTSTSGTISFDLVPDTLTLETNDVARDVIVRDLNFDGQSDIIVSNGSPNNSLFTFENNHNTASLNLTKSEFTRYKRNMGAGVSSDALVVDDFNNDGWPDIATTPYTSGSEVSILLNPKNNTADFSSSPTPIKITFGGGTSTPMDIASADFDKKNGPDLVITDRNANQIRVLLNQGVPNFAVFAAPVSKSLSLPWGVDVADMNGDGFADFVVGSKDETTRKLDVFIYNGAAAPAFPFTQAPIPGIPVANWFVKVGDYDGDARPDIACTVTLGSANFGIKVYKNQHCHKPVILQGSSITLCAPQDTILTVVPMHGVKFDWSTGQTGFQSRVITPADALVNGGVITVTADGGTGCSAVQTSITIVDGGGSAPAAQTISGPTGVCEGSSLALTTATAPGTTPSYIWTGPNGFSQTTSSPNVTVIPAATSAQTGDYYLQISEGGCNSNLSPAKPVLVVPAPTSFSIIGPTGGICENQLLELTATDDPNYTYQWNKVGTGPIAGETTSTFPKVPRNALVGDNGNYTVDITAFTCPVSVVGPFALKVFTAPVATFTKDPTQVCVGTAVTFDGSASAIDETDPKPTSVKYDWSFGDGVTILDNISDTQTHTYSVQSASRTATLIIRYPDAVGCTSTTFSDNFAVSNAIQPTIKATDINDVTVTEACGDGTLTVFLRATPGFNSYTWTPTAPNDSVNDVNAPGLYSLETVDGGGCVGNATITLLSMAGCEATSASIPKVFTPNGDGANDFWVIKGEPNLTECQMSVFDGRGRRIFEVKGYPSAGWDGVANGKQVPDGTYYYVMGCPGAKPVTGSVLIVR